MLHLFGFPRNSVQISPLVSEIHVTECMIDPLFIPSVAADSCSPPTTKEEDALKGKWVRVERNLKLQLSAKSLVRFDFLLGVITFQCPPHPERVLPSDAETRYSPCYRITRST